MNIAQGMFLSMLRNTFFKLFLFSPTLWYLINKLRLDIVSFYVQGQSTEDVLTATGRKLREEWKLLVFRRIRFYRELEHEGYITKKQLARLEKNAGLVADALDQTRLLEIPISSLTAGERMLIAITEKKPVPLPWERDQYFFDKHPAQKRALIELRQNERQFTWHEEIWLALIDGL
jgi:hypothetical protein